MLDIQIAAAKTNKYASRESGDTVEVVERPGGGFTALLADGQGSGRASKTISQIVAGRALAMLKDGARDGSVARAVHDYLYMHRGGKVSAELTLLSVDFASQTVILTRNTHCPTLVRSPEDGAWRAIADRTPAIGIHRHTRPQITELPLAAGLWVVAVSDGILEAGQRAGQPLDLLATVAALCPPADLGLPILDFGLEGVQSVEQSAILPLRGAAPPQSPIAGAAALADGVLAQAAALDQGRPQDDMSVLVLALLAGAEEDQGAPRPLIRRFDLRVPLE